MNSSSFQREKKRFIKFTIVGALGAVVDFGVMNLLTSLFGMSLVIAGVISFICAVMSNFIWNRFWTYPDSRSRPILQQLVMFAIVNGAGVIIRVPILFFLEPPILHLTQSVPHPRFLFDQILAKNLTLAVAVGIVMLWNFFVNRYWTYNDVDQLQDRAYGE